ncbi:hypothetical protein ACIRP7_43525 [Streptomyces sp. NPDC102270]|uniref:hypothetical protein n=1 Tax=Streptomyces sp. NPDC102270 TaxID=3366150 RepID=UPI00380A3B4A
MELDALLWKLSVVEVVDPEQSGEPGEPAALDLAAAEVPAKLPGGTVDAADLAGAVARATAYTFDLAAECRCGPGSRRLGDDSGGMPTAIMMLAAVWRRS